jgi:dual specificity MAP kinase phosphatase
MTLHEAFLHLQVACKRSFFLYPVDKPLLKRIDEILFQARATAPRAPSPTSPTSPRWKWGFRERPGSPREEKAEPKAAVIKKPEEPAWFTDRRFDGFPSRILPFLYLGNL